jgi:hypothetical protein
LIPLYFPFFVAEVGLLGRILGAIDGQAQYFLAVNISYQKE